MADSCYSIAGWRFDPAEPALRGDRGERRLEDRAARVLAVLCARRGEVVSKAELIAAVWGGRSVSANSVSIVIGSLRRALGDDRDDPAILVTVARRGYRLAIEPEPPDRSSPRAPAGHRRRLGLASWLVGLAGVIVVTVLVLPGWGSSAGVTVVVETPRNVTGQPELDALATSLGPVLVHGVGRLDGVQVVDGAGAGRPRVVVRSRLILWNGAPELAVNAIDTARHTIIWSGFAAGPPALLARHADDKLGSLGARLPGRGGILAKL